jgi:hypothetical protein
LLRNSIVIISVFVSNEIKKKILRNFISLLSNQQVSLKYLLCLVLRTQNLMSSLPLQKLIFLNLE